MLLRPMVKQEWGPEWHLKFGLKVDVQNNKDLDVEVNAKAAHIATELLKYKFELCENKLFQKLYVENQCWVGFRKGYRFPPIDSSVFFFKEDPFKGFGKEKVPYKVLIEKLVCNEIKSSEIVEAINKDRMLVVKQEQSKAVLQIMDSGFVGEGELSYFTFCLLFLVVYKYICMLAVEIR